MAFVLIIGTPGEEFNNANHSWWFYKFMSTEGREQ